MKRAVIAAGGLTALFAVAHATGLRGDVAVLSGAVGSTAEAVGGVAYALLYFGVVLVVPIILIAAGIRWAIERFAR